VTLYGTQSRSRICPATPMGRTPRLHGQSRHSFVTMVFPRQCPSETWLTVDGQISDPTWPRMLAGATALQMAEVPGHLTACPAERIGADRLARSRPSGRFASAERIVDLGARAHEKLIEDRLRASAICFPLPQRKAVRLGTRLQMLSTLLRTVFSTMGLGLRWSMERVDPMRAMRRSPSRISPRKNVRPSWIPSNSAIALVSIPTCHHICR